jgi:hypothetical protein
VVTDGDTVAVPDAATEPIPGAIETVVAPVVFQASVLLLPATIVDGDAVKLAITGGVGVFTVTVARAVTVPLALVAVRV